jgi:hypothetical protein
MLRTTALWQNIGSPMCGFRTTNDRQLQPCEACGLTCGHLFVICPQESPTSQALVQRVQQAYLRQLSLNDNNRVRTKTLLAQTVELNGVSVCLPCAGPSLGALHRQQHLAVAQEHTSLRGRVFKLHMAASAHPFRKQPRLSHVGVTRGSTHYQGTLLSVVGDAPTRSTTSRAGRKPE